MSDNAHIFVLGHDDRLKDVSVPESRSYEKLNLNHLPGLEGDNRSNQLSETRLYLSSIPDNLPDADGIGVVTWQYDQKFCGRPVDSLPPRTTTMDKLSGLTIEKGVLLCPHRSPKEWFVQRCWFYPGVPELLKQAAVDGHPLSFDNYGPYSNNFICHREDFIEFVKRLRAAHRYFYDLYGLDIPFTLKRPEGSPDFLRKTGFLYERLTMCLWGGMEGIEIRQLP